MPSNCVFEFDRPDPIYYSGETINGRIVLNTTSNKSVNGNKLKKHENQTIEKIYVYQPNTDKLWHALRDSQLQYNKKPIDICE